MKAVRVHRYGDASGLRVDEVERPTPGPGQALVRIHAASVNPVDWKIREGTQRVVVRLALPATLGMDLSGVVEAVGPGVTRFTEGDEVFSSVSHRRQGTYAEYLAVNEPELANKPANLDHAEAASIPMAGLTAWGCLVDKGRVREGQKVFVQAGSGGVGSFAIQLARHLGATVATSCSTRNIDLVRELGAAEVVDYTKHAPADVLSGHDLAIDAFGGKERAAIRKILRPGGRLITINSELAEYGKRIGPRIGLLISISRLLGSAVWGLISRGVRTSLVVRKADGAALGEIARLIEAGAIKPLVDKIFPLDELAEAHKYSETGRARGKIVIAVREGD